MGLVKQIDGAWRFAQPGDNHNRCNRGYAQASTSTSTALASLGPYFSSCLDCLEAKIDDLAASVASFESNMFAYFHNIFFDVKNNPWMLDD